MAGQAFAAKRALGSDAIPYPSSGTYNPTTYTFTAATDGDVSFVFTNLRVSGNVPGPSALELLIGLAAPIAGLAARKRRASR